jgi:hypothetical protein
MDQAENALKNVMIAITLFLQVLVTTLLTINLFENIVRTLTLHFSLIADLKYRFWLKLMAITLLILRLC